MSLFSLVQLRELRKLISRHCGCIVKGSTYVSSSAETDIALVDTPVKMAGATTLISQGNGIEDGGQPNRLQYVGNDTTLFDVTAALSVTAAGSNKNFTFYVYKYDSAAASGSVLPQSAISMTHGVGPDLMTVFLAFQVSLSKDDYIEVWAENNTDDTNITAVSGSFNIMQ